MRAAAQLVQGSFTAVDAVGLPSSATPGTVVNFSLTVRSLWGYVPVSVTALVNGIQVAMAPDYATPSQGQSQLFIGSFTMPGQTATVSWYVWYFSAGLAAWELDGQGSNVVQVQTTGGMWGKLASQDVNLGIGTAVGWSKLASRDVNLAIGTTAGWNKLASRDVNLAIAPPVTWSKLSSMEVVISPGFVIPKQFNLVLDNTYPAGKTYKGKAEQCIASFNLDTFGLPGTTWYAEHLASNFANEAKKQGGTMLSLKLYEYKASAVQWQYIIVAVAVPTQVPRGAVGFPFPWTPVIIAALAIILLITLVVLIREVKTIDWTSPAGLAVAGVTLALVLAAGGGLIAVIAASKVQRKAG